VTQEHIRADDRKFIESITVDDREVYTLLSKQIAASGQNAISGKDITGIERYS
jgi:hypothetical protein